MLPQSLRDVPSMHPIQAPGSAQAQQLIHPPSDVGKHLANDSVPSLGTKPCESTDSTALTGQSSEDLTNL